MEMVDFGKIVHDFISPILAKNREIHEILFLHKP